MDRRISFGKFAELNRSHYTPDTTTTEWLDELVDALTDGLETRFPERWAQAEDHVYAAEAMLFHLPYDPATGDTPVFLNCPPLPRPRRRPAARASPRRPTTTGRTPTPRAQHAEARSPPGRWLHGLHGSGGVMTTATASEVTGQSAPVPQIVAARWSPTGS